MKHSDTPPFFSTQETYTNGILACVHPLVVQYIYFVITTQPRGHTGMGQVFTFARVGWWNIVHVRMLHPIVARLE